MHNRSTRARGSWPGNIWVTGRAFSGDFPVKNAWQKKTGGLNDVFVSKFSSSGELLYSTFLGGGGQNFTNTIVIDEEENVWVSGIAGSGFPITKDAWQKIMKRENDAFVSKLSSTGDELLYF